MRIVTAGAGLRAGTVLARLLNAMPEARIVGYFDPSPGHLEMIGGDAVPRYPGVEAMLSDARPDLLFVGSPNLFHLEQIRLGLEAGVRILVEKPIVSSVADTFVLADLLANHGVDRVLVGLVLRYSQTMADLRSAMSRGALGTIASMEGNEHIGPYHGAFFMRDWRRHAHLSGGYMLEKCCHDLDIYNMIAGARPRRVASFGGRRSFVPENAPAPGGHDDVYLVKTSVWNSTPDPFRSDGDIVDCQTAILEYETGASLAFHTNTNVPDEHRRFCVIGAHGMAEGDFVRGYLRITDARTNRRILEADYSDRAEAAGHYGSDEAMVRKLAAFLRESTENLPVSAVDAMEAGLAALAVDEARSTGRIVNLTDTWSELDRYGLRK